MNVWLALGGMAAVTFLLRASLLLLPERVALPALVARALRYVPAAVLTAIWAPELLLHSGSLYVSTGNARLAAGVAAIVVAWHFRRTFVTIAAGMLALHLFS